MAYSVHRERADLRLLISPDIAAPYDLAAIGRHTVRHAYGFVTVSAWSPAATGAMPHPVSRSAAVAETGHNRRMRQIVLSQRQLVALARLAGVAVPIAVLVMLLGVLRAVVGRALGGDPLVGGAAAVAQALGGVWIAVLIGLPIAHRIRGRDRDRGEPPGRRSIAGSGNRPFLILFPSFLGVTRLVEARLTAQLTPDVIAATLAVTVVFTLAVLGAYRWRDRRRPDSAG